MLGPPGWWFGDPVSVPLRRRPRPKLHAPSRESVPGVAMRASLIIYRRRKIDGHLGLGGLRDRRAPARLGRALYQGRLLRQATSEDRAAVHPARRAALPGLLQRPVAHGVGRVADARPGRAA